MPLDRYRGYKIIVDYDFEGRLWTATFEPGSVKPHPVIVRVPGNEGEATLTKRAANLIDELERQKTQQKNR